MVGLLSTGCATRAAVGAVQREADALRTELTEVRLAQDLVSADLARVLAELQSLEARAAETQAALRESASELARLRARLQAAEEDELRRTNVAAPAAQPPVAAPPPRPATPPAALPAPTDGERPRRVMADEPADDAYAGALNTFRAREHGQAVLDFMDFIATYPTHVLAPQAQYWIGEAYYVERDYRQALIEFHRVLEMADATSTAADTLVRIGMCHASLREPARAAAAWHRVVREHPQTDAAARARALLRTRASARQP